MSNKNPGKKNKAKLEKAALEKAAADRKKAKKTATKEQKAEIRAKEREAKQTAKLKAKAKSDKEKALKKEQRAADREKYDQLKADREAKLEALEEKKKLAYQESDEEAEKAEEAVSDESDDTEAGEITEAEESADPEEITEADSEQEDTGSEDEDNEDNEEDEEDEEDGIHLCACCGENPAQEGSEYCEDCEELLLRTHLPVRGFIIALVSVITSFFVLIIMGLLSSSSLQIFKGDFYMSQRNYDTAFTVYDDVSGIISTITENFGSDSIFTSLVSTGSNFDVRAMECAAEIYGPLDALESFDSNIFTSNGAYYFKQYSPKYKKLSEMTDEFQSTVSAINDVLTEIANDEDLTLEEYNSESVPELEKFLGKDDVNDVFLRYVIAYYAESSFSVDNDQLLKYVEKIDEAAKADGRDYSWLYYELYTTLLVETDNSDKATPYLMEMMENDLSNYYSRIQMCRILVSEGKTDDAAAIVNEYQANNVIDDDYTEDAYALLIYMSRALGNYETALHYATSALETYTYVPEIRRQQAMAYMSMGYYAEAFDAAYQASTDANYISSYYAISDFDGTLIDETLYIAAYLAKDDIQDDEDAMANYEDVIATYSAGDYVPTFAQKIIDGEITITQALTEGTCDFI